MGYYFHFSHFLGEETFWINLKIQDYNLICQKPAHFLSAQMALVSTFIQMYIVLGMYV